MSFADNINRLCAERGTKLTPFLKSLGFSGSKATFINKGQIPNNEKDLMKIAKGLDCSVMDLFANKNDIILNQNNNVGTISNHVAPGETHNTNHYSAQDSYIDKNVPITSDSKEYFFTMLDKLKNMDDSNLLEMIRYADFILSKNENPK